ncbi:MAG: c-type cytochrome [Pseudorhodoferax sp.]
MGLPAQADQALAAASNCMGCHRIDKRLVGPPFKDIAARYRGDQTAVDRLAAKIRQGGTGVWGVQHMPANPQVSEADARKLAAWVLSL